LFKNLQKIRIVKSDRLLEHIRQKPLPECLKWVGDAKQIADKYKLKLVCYEAGQHLVGVGGGENNNAMTKLFQTANRHPRMGEIYAQYLDGWKQAGGDLMCIFSSTGTWSKWGSWGLTEYFDETEHDQPKYKTVLDWNRQNPRE
ncbi:MAG: cellulose-binding protein, partial [Verrucomicrobiota bacterium]